MNSIPPLLRSLWLSLLLWLALAAPWPGVQGATPPRLNVLFIVADDLRDTVGCLGNRFVKTPNLDRLAAKGVRFERAYAQYPVCNPSRTSFLTGLRCEQTGVVDNRWFFRDLLPDVVTLPELLRSQGWWAGSYGKILHVGEAYGEFRPGWTDEGRSWDEARMFPPAPDTLKLEGRNLTGGVLAWCHWASMDGPDDAQPDGQNARHALEAIERQTAAGRPWFVGAGFHRPHDPFVVPKKYFDLYPPGSIPLHRDPADLSTLPPLAMPGGAFAKAFQAFTDQERFEFLRAYYAGVSFTDAQIGRLLDTLDRLRLWETTLVVFLGDHGYHLGERDWWNKNTLFDRSCRAPLILAAPGARAGGVCRNPVEFVDLFPTVTDYCGVATPSGLAGRSLRSQLEDPDRPGKPAAFSLVSRGGTRFGQAVHTRRWHLNHWSDGREELYDLESDPGETRDLSASPDHEPIRAGLRRQLETVGRFEPRQPPPNAIKKLLLPGEAFRIGGRPAFVLLPQPDRRRRPQPWVLYAPTLPPYPDAAETWMHQQFVDAGIAVAGIDVGEAYGSPAGREGFAALHRELTEKRGFAPRPCLLGRSRGGLLVSAWAGDHPDQVAGLAGIYPVFDLRSYPGLERAAPAFGLSVRDLQNRLDTLNPLALVSRLAEARIPVFLLHGDADTVVPLPANSGAVAGIYRASGAGDLAQLEVLPGRGHDMDDGFFHSQALVDFVIRRANAGAIEPPP